MDVSAVQSTAPSAFSDVGTSGSAKVAAMSRAVPEENDENWPDDGWWWDYGEPRSSSDCWFEEEWSREPYEDAPSEQEQWVCSVRRVEETERATKFGRSMLDSGGQSTGCTPSFAPDYEVDVTENARLHDIQDQPIESYGKKIVDIP